MTIDVGERLRAIRGQQGLSQRELAEKAGLTHVTISHIEQNRVSPNLATLKKILDGLSMSLAAFFAAEERPKPKIFYRKDELTELGDGAPALRQVGADLRGRALQILHEFHAPGSDTGEAMYSHEGEEGAIVVRGRIEITVGDEKRVLGPGDAFYFESRRPHRLRTVGDEVCEIVSACTPPTF